MILSDPRPGTVVELPAGSQLCVRFRKGIGASRWHVSCLPSHLVPLSQGGHEFTFLVFDGGPDRQDVAVPLRLERRHPDRGVVHEVCEVQVVPTPGGREARPVTGDGDARTSRSASRRTA